MPAPLEVPFPSDVYLGADGLVTARFGSWQNLGVTLKGSSLSSGLAGLDGFGRSVGAMFLVDDAQSLDPATLIDGQSVALVDLEARSVVASESRFVSGFHTLVVQPKRLVLEPGHRYAAVVTRAVKTLAGVPLGPPVQLQAVLNGTSTATGARLYADALPALKAAGFAANALAAFTVFTTQTRHRLLRRTRDALVAGHYGAAPNFTAQYRFGRISSPGLTASLDAWFGPAPRGADGVELPGASAADYAAGRGPAHDDIGAVLNGSMGAPELRRPFKNTPAVDDGTVLLDSEGLPTVIDAEARVPVTFILPRTAPPPSGWPVVMYGHGTPVHRLHVMGVANALAKAGLAVALIDAPDHGMRAPGATDTKSIFPGTFAGPDGLADANDYASTGLIAQGNFVNFARARDTRVQTTFEYCQLRRLVANPALDLSAAADQYPGATPHLDGTKIAWLGVSFGGINGMVLAGVEPAISTFVLDVGGGLEFVTIGESPANAGFAGLALTTFGFDDSVALSRFHPGLTVGQMIADGTDAASFAFDATHRTDGTAANLLLIQVDHDELVPNSGSDVVLSMMGVPQVSQSSARVEGLSLIDAPVQGNAGSVTQVALTQPLGVHGRNLLSRSGTRTARAPFPNPDVNVRGSDFLSLLPAPVVVRSPIAATQRAAVRFITSGWNGAATLDITGMDLWFDFDDDGWPDDDETRSGTDVFDPASHPSGPPLRVRSDSL